MEKIIVIILICSMAAIINGVLGYLIIRDSKDKSDIIRMPRIVILIEFICEMGMLVFGIIAYIYGAQDDKGPAILFWLFSFLFFLFLWYSISFQIKVADDSFEKRNFLWQKKKYNFSETIFLQGAATMIIQDHMGIEIMRISDIMDNSRLLYERYLSYLEIHKLKRIKSQSNLITCIKFLKHIGILLISMSILMFTASFVIAVFEKSIAGIIITAIFAIILMIPGIVMLLYFYRWNIHIENDEMIIHRVFGGINRIKLNECYLLEERIFLVLYNKQTNQKIYWLAEYILNNASIILEYYGML